jgi:hypothetical protein
VEVSQCIGTLKSSGKISSINANALKALWANANQDPGVRHGHNATDGITEERATFAIETAHAAAKLLLALDR